jgi:uncharacterized protein (TIGR00369 family)
VDGLLDLGRAVLAAQPFSLHVGAELVRLEPGEAEIVLPIEPHLGQQHGFVHGGVLAFLIDNAVTFAGGSVLGPKVLTQEIKVSYLRPARGDRLVARAHVLHSSKRQAVCRCDVFSVEGDDETLCAAGMGTIMATDAPSTT